MWTFVLGFLSACIGGRPSAGLPDTAATDVESESGSEDSGSMGDVSARDSENREPCEIGGAIICCPGDTQGCTDDGRGLYICRGDRTGWERQDCVGEAGASTQCRYGPERPDGYCSACDPGRRKCQDDEVILACNEGGTEFIPYDTCNGATTGSICFNGGCVSLCEVNDKLNMYIGCEFWGADLDNAFVPGGGGYLDADGAQYAIVVSNPHPRFPAEITVFNNAGPVLADSDGVPFPTAPLAPGGLRVYNLPRRDVEGTTLAPLAYRVVSSIPIMAYQFNPLENVGVYSNDASLLLPTNVLGKYYFIMTREQTFVNLRVFLTVIGVQNNTRVTVDITAPTLVGMNHKTGQAIRHYKPGESATFTLDRFDVLNIETDEIGSDLTGSVVLANRNVAVFGGSEASNAPNTNHCDKVKRVCEWDGITSCRTNADCTAAGFNTCCADHLEQQLFPVKSWGRHYLASKTFPRNQELDVYRIIAAEDNTVVTMVPPQASVPVLNRGEWVDFESRESFEIHAKKPIMAGQFLAAEDAPVPGKQPEQDAGIGDPAFILLVPNEQFRDSYVFLAPDKYELDYVTIIAPDLARVWFNCDALELSQAEALCDPLEPDDFERFGTGDFMTTRFRISDGIHRVLSDQPMGVYVYGYDRYVSYGYPAGLNVQDLGLIKEPGE